MLVTCVCGSPTVYNCNTCGAKLCVNCKQAHLENNDTRHHSITEYAKKLMPGSLSPPPCHEHNGKECICWCQTCGKAACMDCVTKSHRGHEFTKLETILQEKRGTLQQELKNLESNKLKEWQDLMIKAKKMTSDFSGQVDEIEKELEERAKEFHTGVEEIKETYKKQLNELKIWNLCILKEQEKMVSKGLEKVKQEIKECEDRLRSSDMESLLEHEGAKSDKKDTLPTILCVTPPVLTPSQINTKALTEMFGQLTISPTQLIPKPSVQSQFVTKISEPSVICVGSGEAWVKTEKRTIQLVDRHGTVKDTIHPDFWFYDMVVSPQGDILLTDWDNKCIKAISRDKTIKTLFKLQWRPFSLCCLNSGNIAVTFPDEGRVLIYSVSGKVIKELDKKLFRDPWRVAQSKVNSDLYISDIGAEKVVALDKDYRVRYQYTGQDDIESFYPHGLCTDNAGRVLITDNDNHTVHILGKDGEFRQFLLTEEQGIVWPWSINVDREGNAWVGGGGGVKVVKYLQ